jgi:hypothetical protein
VSRGAVRTGRTQPGYVRRRWPGTIGSLFGALASITLLAACASGQHARPSIAAAGTSASSVAHTNGVKHKHKPSSTTNSSLAQATKFTQCMRSHGVTNFPYPAVVSGQIVFSGPPGIGREPKFLSAQGACGYLLGGKPVEGGGSG